MKTLSELIPVFLVSMSIGGLIMPLLAKLLASKSLIDRKSRRKIHVREVPTMGGVGFVLAFLFTILMFGTKDQLLAHRFELITLTVMFLVGMRDDIIELSPLSKILAQLIPAAMIIYFSGLSITSLYGFLNINTLHPWVSVVLTLFVILGLTNSFNLIDGMDGLASTIALLAIIFFGTWFFLLGYTSLAFICTAFAGSLIAFLYFNWQPAKIFMGDSGALVLGFLISILAINFMELNSHLSEKFFFHFSATIGTAVSVLIIPIFDTSRVVLIRLLKGRSPFIADKNHTHHTLMKLGFTHSQTTLTIAGVNLVFIALSVLLRHQSDYVVLPILILLAVNLSLILDYVLIRKIKMEKGKVVTKPMTLTKSNRQAS